MVTKKKKAKAVVKSKKQVSQKKSTVKKVAKKVPAKKKAVVAKSTIKKSKPATLQKTTAVRSKTQNISKPKKTETQSARLSPAIERSSYLSEELAVNEENLLTAPPKATTLLGALEFKPYQSKPNEAYMSESQRLHFRSILDAWKQQLMQDVDATVGHLKEDAVFYADPVDRASQEEGFNLELRTRDRERRLIKKIEQSLDLINAGEYGYCEDCGAEIGIRRLEARPTAVKCIDCKTFQEIREKQLGG